MKTLKFKIEINAPKEKVWNILWEDASYRKWTATFCEGGYAVTDWKENSKALFLTPNGEGMVNRDFFKRLPATNYTGPICQHHEYELGENEAMRAHFKKTWPRCVNG